ncbi:hypothetical protein C0Q70_01681 [Pomacea canaliculata]|uniref:Uncharacterized protein n=1 Tax=Pomacea canaliculata TaxID=400727 RepID=A0A2T7Q055_POMCA|nr:hypothetical protein C0Q70_01681 [Pomacea canaliculata]
MDAKKSVLLLVFVLGVTDYVGSQTNICMSTCLNNFQSILSGGSSQATACAIAQSYISCLESSCHTDSSQYVSHINLGLTQQGFTTCGGSSDAEPEPEADALSNSSTVSCSVLQVIAVLMIAFLL